MEANESHEYDKTNEAPISKRPRDIRDLVYQTVNVIARVYPRREAVTMAGLIYEKLKGWDVIAIIINGDRPVSDYLLEQANAVLVRVLKGEPLQYILGEAYFYGLHLKVSPDVLIPRPETAELVDLICDENKEKDLRVLDVGTGSGAIAISLSRNLAFSDVTAVDISESALSIARENAEKYHARVKFLHEDIFKYSPAGESFDIIVSNPPYITESEKKAMERNVLDYEPAGALFVPDDNPLLYYSRISTIGESALTPGGHLYFEINPKFSDRISAMLGSGGYEDIRIIEDIHRRKRFAAAKRPLE